MLGVSSGGLRPLRQFASEKVADDRGDLGRMAFQREVAGLEQVNLGIRIVALVGVRAGGQEKWIVLAPDREKRRPAGADVVLEFGIERDIALIIAEQIELDLVVAGAGEQRGVQGPGVR